jgi:pimeloyl-ACP methyl ester carboxylesterase
VDVETLVVDDGTGLDLGVALAGERGGFPLLLHAGSPGSRVLDADLVELAAEYGFWLLSYDRPGYGLSASRDGRRVADGAGDVRRIADFLGVERLAVWGFSGGGPFALACGAREPNRVAAACVFASVGPRGQPGLDFAAERTAEFRNEVELYFTDRSAARRKHRREGLAALAEMSQASWWMTRWGERAGSDFAHSLQLAQQLAANAQEAARQGDQGWWEDWGAFLNPWNFEVSEIRCPVQLWHGEQDMAVPVVHGRWLAQRIPVIDAHILANEDHSTIEIDNRSAALRWLRDVTR